MNKGLSKTEAKRTIRFVETALKRGAKPIGMPVGKNEKGATAVAAMAMGLSPQAVWNRVRPGGTLERQYGLKVDWAKWKAPAENPAPEKPAPSIDLERRFVVLQDENADLKRKLKEAYRDALDTEAIREILGGFVAAAAAPPDWIIRPQTTGSATFEVPSMIWSDWHAGECVSRAETNGVNEFDLAIFERRVKRLVETTIHLCRNHGPGHYPGAVINLLGDMLSGGIHPELLKTDEEEVLPTALRVRDLLIWAIERMLDCFGRIYIPCTSGNHGRATQKPEFKRYIFKNFDWLIYQLLARHFERNADIVFDIPESNEVHYRVYDQRYLALHGDMLGVKGGDGIIGSIGPIMRGEVKVGKQSAAIGRDYDVLLMGHWHQQLWLPRAIVANTLKGFDEYAKNALRAPPSIPSQPLWFVHPKWGKTAHRDVFLEDPGFEDGREWVSFSRGIDQGRPVHG